MVRAMSRYRAPIVSNTVESAVTAAGLAAAANAPKEYVFDPQLQPPPPSAACRSWVKAPRSAVTTVATRKDWFRVMQYNVMVDFTTQHVVGQPSPKPRAPVMIQPKNKRGAPSSAADKTEGPGGVDADGAAKAYFTTEPVSDIDTSRCPPDALQWADRERRILQEVDYFDPDIITMNELNRTTFNTTIWRHMRSRGYGALFVSARRTKTMSWSNCYDKDLRAHTGKLPYEQDIGNAIFFHKGRFFPYQQAGPDFPRHFPFMHMCGLRDRISNVTLLTCLVQLCPGDTAAAVETRRVETEQILRVLKGVTHDTEERMGLGVLVVGDLHTTSFDEPCIKLLREKYDSIGDVIGGPSWTQWHRRPVGATDTKADWEEEVRRTVDARRQRRQMTGESPAAATAEVGSAPAAASAQPIVPLTLDSVVSRLAAEHAAEKAAKGKHEDPPTASSGTPLSTASTINNTVESNVTATSGQTAASSSSAPFRALLSRPDDELMRIAERATRRTTDFMFVDPHNVSTLQVLDVPPDGIIDPETLLPSPVFPSHHIPFIADMCWNTFAPVDTAAEMPRDHI